MLLRPVAILGTALALVQCASGPSLDRWVELSPDDEVVVVYSQPANRKSGTPALRQTLMSEAVVSANELYSSPDSDPLAKAAPVETMQLLLDGFATAGFFERSLVRPVGTSGRLAPASATQAPVPGMSALVVVHGGQSFTMMPVMGAEKPEEETTADWTAYSQALSIFQNVYNGTEAFHIGSGDADVFEQEQQRLIREARERLRGEQGDRP